MKWKHLPIVAFDTETTGLDPFGGDRIIEVALVVFRLDAAGRVASAEHHAHLVNPGIPIPRKVTELTGLKDDDVAGKPPFSHVVAELAELFEGSVAVAHNYPFDLAFLTQEFTHAGQPWREPLAAVDTVDISMRHFADAKNHKLSDVTRRLDISLVDAHRAAADAEACGRAFIELARRHEVPDDLQELLDWAVAIGRPPEGGPIEVDVFGAPIFGEGPHAGEPVQEHPLHMAWMEKARIRRDDGTWDWRYPASTRRWVRRWLDVRGAGRVRQAPKSFRAGDWVLDPCIATSRQRNARG